MDIYFTKKLAVKIIDIGEFGLNDDLKLFSEGFSNTMEFKIVETEEDCVREIHSQTMPMVTVIRNL